MIVGSYHLELTCSTSKCRNYHTFVEDSRTQCLNRSTSEGWKLFLFLKQAYCPTCSEAHRKQIVKEERQREAKAKQANKKNNSK